MAEQIPYGAASNIISNLASFAFTEFGRIYGVMDEMKKLQETLESIKVVISRAELSQLQDPVNDHWVRRFKQVLIDADDLLDALAIKDLRRKVNDGGSKSVRKVREFFSSENQIVFRAKLARKIEDIRKGFNGVADDMSNLKLSPNLIVLRQNESDGRETSSFVLPSDIIGREENKSEIIDLLKQTNTNQNVSLIAIVGIGGLGKTALAQLVYNDADVHKFFHKKMWVCVSEDFEVKLLLKNMLKSLKNMEVGDLGLDQLQKMVQDELSGHRYLLVLDDVWNESQLKWNDLKTYLMCGGEGSKIVVTTRSEMVSETMGIKNPYVLKGLTKEQSWTLLKNLTFGDDTSGMSQSLESIGERIAQKCGGVPLAIKTMGGFLRNINKDDDHWLNILNDNIWKLCEESGSIIPVLKLSYQNLPLELRQCFTYCSLYPKDWTIDRHELIQLWMAQGYLISSNETQSLEDVGNQYVKILLMRSFFQDASISEYGDIIDFKMHDLMHDLATSVAGNDCLLVSKGKGIVGRPMHVAFERSTVCSLDMFNESKVRTILRCPATFRLLNPSFKKKLKYLRDLDLSHSSITQLPESIDTIKYLRYLDLSLCVELISLPKSIGNLVCLQTLKLILCAKLVFPIEVIPKLINLRFLDIGGCKAFKEMMPSGLGKLTSLRFLSSFVVGDNVNRKCGKLNELKELNNIGGFLEIINLDLVEDILEAKEANLKAKKRIRYLDLSWDLSWGRVTNKNNDSLQLLDNLCPHPNLRELIVRDYPGQKFSSWLSSLNHISEIYLFGLRHCQHLPPLERLSCLKKLLIRNMVKLQYIHYEEISDLFFPSLKTIIFASCESLRGWQWLGNADNPNDTDHLSLPPFHHLTDLEISHCPKLTSIPAFPHLKHLKLYDCSMKLVNETCLVQLEPSSLLPLSTLMSLKIGYAMEVEAMGEDWMQNLTSLKRLTLSGMSIIQHMSQLHHLPSQLDRLQFREHESDKLCVWENEDNNSTQLQAPYHCLRSLQTIEFKECKSLRALPEQIGDLHSLRHIKIEYCPELESLPEAMYCLTNLQTLRISGCPLLLDRCKDESGEDWPKIAHIPNKDIS